MRITSWNILHGMGIPPAPNGGGADLPTATGAIVEQVAPDLIAVQECDYRLPRSGQLNQIAQVAQAMGARDYAFAPCVIGTPGESWRKITAIDQLIISNHDGDKSAAADIGSYGIGIASKIPVKQWHRLNLGNSPVGMPLLIPGDESGPGKIRPMYIRDEPRVALAATLENGFTVINTHLSFVPGFNFKQLRMIKRWAADLAREMSTEVIIMGDLNLPKNLPIVGSQWKSLATQLTYPSWGAKIQFDYVLALRDSDTKALATVSTGVSDHLPLSVEII
jgi:endonuclease/exonuclease/phosphatase family metal-dependent hydrolase